MKLRFTEEIQWLEIIILLILIPCVIYLMKYLFKYTKYATKIIGTYTDNSHKAIINITYPFCNFDYSYMIEATEPGGQIWRGRYKLSEDGLILSGTYQWNYLKKQSFPDSGNHVICFSPDYLRVNVHWKKLSGVSNEGLAEWIKRS